MNFTFKIPNEAVKEARKKKIKTKTFKKNIKKGKDEDSIGIRPEFSGVNSAATGVKTMSLTTNC